MFIVFTFLIFDLYIFNILLQMTKVITTPVKIDVSSLTDEQCAMFEKNIIKATKLQKVQEHKLQEIIDKIDNLTAVYNQIKNDKEVCDTYKLL